VLGGLDDFLIMLAAGSLESSVTEDRCACLCFQIVLNVVCLSSVSVYAGLQAVVNIGVNMLSTWVVMSCVPNVCDGRTSERWMCAKLCCSHMLALM
jgi:hypothetical protein